MKPSYKKKIQSPFFLTFSKLTTYEASVQPLQSANYSMNRACDAWSWSFITGLFRAQKRLSVDLSHISTQYWDMTLLIFYLNQSAFTNQRINLPFSGQDQKRPLGGMVRRTSSPIWTNPPQIFVGLPPPAIPQACLVCLPTPIKNTGTRRYLPSHYYLLHHH